MNEVTTEKVIEMGKLDHAIALEKGWWPLRKNGTADFDKRDIRELMFLAISELAEAGEVWRNNKPATEIWYEPPGYRPEGFPIELADMVIRLGDTLAASAMMDSINLEDSEFDVDTTGSPMAMLYDLIICLAGWSSPVVDAASVSMLLGDCAYAIKGAFEIADKLGFDLWNAIAVKREYNKTRSFRHGNKKA